ncbi:MAG TPA: MBL fold metallo-hydrolase [Xanthobacteraceae bacterium]|nr:MBL fold metallo-hydrolase [Xanthobacteraceae bacterium]
MLSRRELLAGSAALALSATLSPPAAFARAPIAGKQVPGIYRQQFGAFEVTALLDGDFTFPPELFPDAKPEEQQALAARAFIPFPVQSPCNAYAVNTGDKLYLIDTGTGTFGTAFPGTHLGYLNETLAAAGIARDDVDAILLTHLHPDHFGGLVREREVQFPKAEIIAPEADIKFWLNPEVAAQAPADAKMFFEMAVTTMKPYESRTRQIAPSGPVVPGIEAVALPGHTVGHTGYMLGSGNDRLLMWGDIVHSAALQFPHPEWTIPFDTDRPQAAAARKRAFDMAATDRIMIAGMHLPFPGLGHVEKDGERYVYQPVAWTPKY